MPLFSAESVRKLSQAHPDLQRLFYEVIKTMDCTVIEGHRDQAEQDADFAAGNSKLKWPSGKHNAFPSNAVDVMPYPIDYKNIQRVYYFAGYVLGTAQKLKDEGKITHSIRWGGNWSGSPEIKPEKFFDGAHFEVIL